MPAALGKYIKRPTGTPQSAFSIDGLTQHRPRGTGFDVSAGARAGRQVMVDGFSECAKTLLIFNHEEHRLSADGTTVTGDWWWQLLCEGWFELGADVKVHGVGA